MKKHILLTTALFVTMLAFVACNKTQKDTTNETSDAVQPATSAEKTAQALAKAAAILRETFPVYPAYKGDNYMNRQIIKDSPTYTAWKQVTELRALVYNVNTALTLIEQKADQVNLNTLGEEDKSLISQCVNACLLHAMLRSTDGKKEGVESRRIEKLATELVAKKYEDPALIGRALAYLRSQGIWEGEKVKEVAGLYSNICHKLIKAEEVSAALANENMTKNISQQNLNTGFCKVEDVLKDQGLVRKVQLEMTLPKLEQMAKN